MKSRPSSKQLKTRTRDLILCEGETERLYLNEVLNSRLCKIETSKSSNVLKLIQIADNYIGYTHVYCIFDQDFPSNTKEKMIRANKIIKNSNDKLRRIFSNPCIERAFLFSFSNLTKEYINCNEATEQLYHNIKKITKSGTIIKKDDGIEKYVRQIIEATDFQRICTNAQQVYKELKINDSNWLYVKDGYSEIFKLIDFKK